MKVAYLGPNEKTYTGQAARKMLPDAELIPLQPIRRVIMAVEQGKFNLGIVPMENIYNGEVRATLDTLRECSQVRIIREDFLDIFHCIGALKNHRDIDTIMSKDEALDQCSRYLCENYPNAQLIATSSTGEAAERIAREKLDNVAAIAPEGSLIEAKLEVLAKSDIVCPNNRTRFLLLGRSQLEREGIDNKTFITIHPPVRDRFGVLHDFTGFFAGLGINLEYIQSRPDWNNGYYFYIELDGHETDKAVRLAIDSVKLSLDPKEEHDDTIKVLGSYKNVHWKDKN